MPAPSRAPVVGGKTPCSAYVLECKLKRAYAALYQQEVGSIWHPPTRKAKAVALLGGDLAATQVRYAEKRLAEALPEVIQRLTLEQQPLLAAVLLTETPDLAQVVALLVKLEHNLNYADFDDALKKDDDDWKAKAVGLGKFRQKLGGTCLQQKLRKQARLAPALGPPLELTPWPPRPVLRTKKKGVTRRAAPVLRGQLSLEFPGGGVTLAAL